MAKRLIITLDENTTNNYLWIAQNKTKAEVDSECEPSGIILIIDISPEPYGASVICENDEIGVASVELVDT
ncbi:hypothetical protein [Geothermobacter ehrlichii]|uniref:hypothetical protein n=1 Tax=Geothermobacter ehrlichii TaxID=213224 RepID=UPI0011E83C58|nr:hypothetical protein [Geothermobacter ehrlichii]